MKKVKMTAKQAYDFNIMLESTCVNTPARIVESRLENSVKADFKKLKRMIKNQLPELYEELSLNFPTGYESNTCRTDKYFILVHLGIEYFLKIY